MISSKGPLKHLRESLVAVVDMAVLDQRDGPLLHLLDDGAIGLVRSLQREDALPRGRRDDQGVHVALADRPQRLLRFGKLRVQFTDFLLQFSLPLVQGLPYMTPFRQAFKASCAGPDGPAVPGSQAA